MSRDRHNYLDRKPIPSRQGYLEGEIVLADLGEKHPGCRYVVWSRNLDDGATGSGDYHDDLNAARRAFSKRAR